MRCFEQQKCFHCGSLRWSQCKRHIEDFDARLSAQSSVGGDQGAKRSSEEVIVTMKKKLIPISAEVYRIFGATVASTNDCPKSG